MVPSDNEKPNEPMLQLHDMTNQYHKISKGITATRLKLDALERYGEPCYKRSSTCNGRHARNGFCFTNRFAFSELSRARIIILRAH